MNTFISSKNFDQIWTTDDLTVWTQCNIKCFVSEHQHYSAWKNLPGHRHGKRFIGRSYKKTADDLLKLSRHQLQMVVAITTGHAPVRRHLYIMGLFDGDPTCRFCRMETETVQHIICWTKWYKNSFNKGHLSLYKRQRVIETELNGVFRAVQ